MTLKEALVLSNSANAAGEPFRVLLACAYSPLHLKTFLAANLVQALPGRTVTVSTGLYGDLPGTLSAAAHADPPLHAIALSIEWPDLDPRLGYRRLGGWLPSALEDIAATCQAQLDWIAKNLASLPSGIPIAIAGPTLAPAPAAPTPGWIASPAELALRHILDGFLLEAARSGARVLDHGYLDRVSPSQARFDARGELFAGFPFSRDHTAHLAAALSKLALPDKPLKGLITDLDDTLWKGLVGEIGAAEVAWDLDRGAQIHGLYQQLLASLSAQGALLAIASKNDAHNVQPAFQRSDIHVPLDAFFPVEVHWEPKSTSIARILETWNVGADSVVFLDDSPGEIGEVQAAHPGLRCIQFPNADPAAALALLRDLRDLFGKTSVRAEDALRLQSIRTATALREASSAGDALDRFLSTAAGKITIELHSADARALELVNKTNQFNLNGIRYTEADWQASLARPGAFTLAVSYEDKFGPLGKIAVLHGAVRDAVAHVDVWVMSCRAFSRRIEHCSIQALFERLGVTEVTFRLAATPKNGPIQSFLAPWATERVNSSVVLHQPTFLRDLPALYHAVTYVE